MPKDSNHLRAPDLRAIYLLLGECCELGADPRVWRSHFLERLNSLFGAVASVDIEASFDPAQACGAAKVDVALTLNHFDADEREVVTRCLREMPLSANPLGLDLVSSCPPNQSVAAVRRERISKRQWERSEIQTEYFGPLGWDDVMFAAVKMPANFRCYVFSRPRGDSEFPLRAARIMQLLGRELALIPSTRLAQMSEVSLLELPPRLREVLVLLAQGDSEKHIAIRLGLSRNTVHEYVRRLFRRFGVSSRGELLTRAARRLHALSLLSDSLTDCLFFQSASV